MAVEVEMFYGHTIFFSKIAIYFKLNHFKLIHLQAIMLSSFIFTYFAVNHTNLPKKIHSGLDNTRFWTVSR